MAETDSPAGWYPDPAGDSTKIRYWNGSAWTVSVRELFPAPSPIPDGSPLQPTYHDKDATPQPYEYPSFLPAVPPNMALVKKGKKLLIATIIIFLVLDFFIIAFNSSIMYVSDQAQEATFELLQGIVRFTLECILFFLIYKGHNWARITAIVLFSFGLLIGIILAVVGAIEAFKIGIGTGIITVLLMAVIVGISAFATIVFCSRSLREYQRYAKLLSS